MSRIIFKRSAITAALLTTLSACSSDGSTDITDLLNVTDVTGITEGLDTVTTATTTDTADIAEAEETTSAPNATDTADALEDANSDNNNEPVALFGPARINLSECGSVPSANTTTTNSINNPSEFFVGEPVNGQLVPGSESNGFHTWQVTLDAGNYHLVVDAWDLQDGPQLLGIDITSLGDVTADNEGILFDLAFDVDLRGYEYLEIRDPQVLTLQIEAVYDQIHNYTMGIFRNGSAVPSPSFNRCLPLNTLALNTTQSVTLDAPLTREDDAWYQVELGSGAFTLDASTSSVEQNLLGYDFVAFNGFGENSSEESVAFGSEFGFTLITSDVYENSFEGTVWIRARNVYNDSSTVEFTLSDL